MDRALQIAEKIRDFLLNIKESSDLEMNARLALDNDIDYIEKCIDVLSSADVEAINSLWHEVQYLSKFFGGDYVVGEHRQRFVELMDDFHEAMLESVVKIRSKS